MYEVSLEFSEVGTGLKNLNIKSEPLTVGEWVSEVEFIPLSEAPDDMMCFTMGDWLIVVKPKLKEGSRYYQDY